MPEKTATAGRPGLLNLLIHVAGIPPLLRCNEIRTSPPVRCQRVRCRVITDSASAAAPGTTLTAPIGIRPEVLRGRAQAGSVR